MSDGLLDVIIMEPFDMLEAPQISIDMFNKTLDKNSKIKTFKTKHIQIHREKPGFIHYDGAFSLFFNDIFSARTDKKLMLSLETLVKEKLGNLYSDYVPT